MMEYRNDENYIKTNVTNPIPLLFHCALHGKACASAACEEALITA